MNVFAWYETSFMRNATWTTAIHLACYIRDVDSKKRGMRNEDISLGEVEKGRDRHTVNTLASDWLTIESARNARDVYT